MKTLQTVNGHQVVIHDMNGTGSFPIKGTIMKKPPHDGNPLRYEIWQANGRVSVFNPSGWDLVMEARS
jgi:hypothetical protein